MRDTLRRIELGGDERNYMRLMRQATKAFCLCYVRDDYLTIIDESGQCLFASTERSD